MAMAPPLGDARGEHYNWPITDLYSRTRCGAIWLMDGPHFMHPISEVVASIVFIGVALVSNMLQN